MRHIVNKASLVITIASIFLVGRYLYRNFKQREYRVVKSQDKEAVHAWEDEGGNVKGVPIQRTPELPR